MTSASVTLVLDKDQTDSPPNNIASTLCFFCSHLSISFLTCFSRSLILSSSCSPSSMTMRAFSSVAYTAVLDFRTLRSFSRRLWKASSHSSSVTIPATETQRRGHKITITTKNKQKQITRTKGANKFVKAEGMFSVIQKKLLYVDSNNEFLMTSRVNSWRSLWALQANRCSFLWQSFIKHNQLYKLLSPAML